MLTLRTLRLSVVLVAGLAVVASVSPVAAADRDGVREGRPGVVVRDARDDILTIGSPRKVSGPLDIYAVTGRVAGDRLLVTITADNLTAFNTRVKEVPAGGGFTRIETPVTTNVRTPTKTFAINPGLRRTALIYGIRSGAEVPCEGDSYTVNLRADRWRYSLPLECLGDPAKVRLAGSAEGIQGGRKRFDYTGLTRWLRTR